MYFTTAFIIAALPFLSIAAPAAGPPTGLEPRTYTLKADASGDAAVNGKAINVVTSAAFPDQLIFAVGGKLDMVCPAGVDAKKCPNVTAVPLLLDPNNGPSLDVSVPGGQLVYFRDNGAFVANAATANGTTLATPENAFNGFQLTPHKPGTDAYLVSSGSNGNGNAWQTERTSGTKFSACPTADADVLQIYASTEALATNGADLSKCHTMRIAMQPYSGQKAYQFGPAASVDRITT